MLRNCVLCLCLAGPASSQDLTALEALTVDACSRHEVLMAEMVRGRGANSADIDEFLAWVEINTMMTVFAEILEQVSTREDTLQWVIDWCRDEPTATIAYILFSTYDLTEMVNEAQSQRLLQEREQAIETLGSRLNAALARLADAQRRIAELEGD